MDKESQNLNKEIIKPFENQLQIGEEKSEAIAHKDSAIKRLDISFNKHIELSEYKKSNLLAYWIKDFSNYHDNEKIFNPNSLKTFKRGDIVKVNLGFNVGNELGGLHYCVVINKKDNPYSGTLNIIPLSSAKENKTYNINTCINLGDELYTKLYEKAQRDLTSLKTKLSGIDKFPGIDETIKITQKLKDLEKLIKEITKMKHGSFALIHQITTISKQRVFKTSILSGIKISDTNLNLIDKKIVELFTK